MQDTNTSAAPWYIVDAGDRKWAELQVLETMISNIEVAMENSKHAVPILQNVFPLVEMPRLSEIPLDGKEVGDEEYKAELKELQAKLGSLHNRLYRKRVPVIITYEGWDAAEMCIRDRLSGEPSSWRPRMLARSKRKPSTR